MSQKRYAIGVDLGTTNCVLSFVDLQAEEEPAQVLPIVQVVSPGEVNSRHLLPSFVYLPHEKEFPTGALSLPWNRNPSQAIGELARSAGAKTPVRLVSSAKSWLCHPGIDRRAPVLPQAISPNAPENIVRISPLQASIDYLDHLRRAWNAENPKDPFEEQDVTITVPASFDPAARELTAEAAEKAGYQQLTLLEEPQAAFYSWIQSNPNFREQVEPGDIILVMDIGGGTTDLSLIAVVDEQNNLELHRVAVGNHILLGGDNMDLALAHGVQTKLMQQGKKLDTWQFNVLTHGCRQAKEQLLSSNTDKVPLVVPSRGSKLIGGTIRTELTRQEVEDTLMEGFFPKVEISAQPMKRARTALTQLGLPYEQDAAITRHLAYFLSQQVDALKNLKGANPVSEHASFLHPSFVLFNGGVFKAEAITHRIMDIINSWVLQESKKEIRALEGTHLDQAVAQGAAYYGYVRNGKGIRIRGGLANAYYVGVETAMPAVPGMEPPIQALCIAPFDLQEGSSSEPAPQSLGLVVGEPVRFRFFASPIRREDQVGEILDQWQEEELVELGAIEATLASEGHAKGEVVPVKLRAHVTEVGTLAITAVSEIDDKQWKVELDVRRDSNR